MLDGGGLRSKEGPAGGARTESTIRRSSKPGGAAGAAEGPAASDASRVSACLITDGLAGAWGSEAAGRGRKHSCYPKRLTRG
jgi:hypothetical protein